MTYLVSRAPETAFAFGEDIEASSNDTIYVADLRTSEIFCFAGSAAVIWCLVEEPMTDENLIVAVADAFDEEIETVKDATYCFINKLVDQKLFVQTF